MFRLFAISSIEIREFAVTITQIESLIAIGCSERGLSSMSKLPLLKIVPSFVRFFIRIDSVVFPNRHTFYDIDQFLFPSKTRM